MLGLCNRLVPFCLLPASTAFRLLLRALSKLDPLGLGQLVGQWSALQLSPSAVAPLATLQPGFPSKWQDELPLASLFTGWDPQHQPDGRFAIGRDDFLKADEIVSLSRERTRGMVQ
jgi:hypothetical protein